MMGKEAARIMKICVTKIHLELCICWFYSKGIYYDARSYEHKIIHVHGRKNSRTHGTATWISLLYDW
jgi:hypothetical protein